ncbi:MAG: phosphatase PAP2 family protein [Trebonia sp.]
MDTLIVWVAQYLLWIMVAGIAAVWLFAESRSGKVQLGLAAVVGVVLGLIFLYIAKNVHTDLRPFVQNPHLKPLFPHPADNGFPSDHSLAAGVIATLVIARHRIIGFVFALGAVAIAWARVAAHVHHVQDVVAGLLIGALAAVIGILVAHWVAPRLLPRLPEPLRDRPAAHARR